MKRYRNETFLFDLIVFPLERTVDSVNKKLRRAGVFQEGDALNPPGEGSCATTYSLYAGNSVVSFWKRPTFSTVAHEAIHVATWACESKQLPSGGEEDEPLAYLVGWITARMLDALGIEDQLP